LKTLDDVTQMNSKIINSLYAKLAR